MSDGILIAVKRSKWEQDLRRYGSESEIKKLYQLQNNAFDRIYASHTRQQTALERLKTALPEATYSYMEELPAASRRELTFLASFGGDNHFVNVSHYAGKHAILGINSDTEASSGVLLYFDTDHFINRFRAAGMNPTYKIESWTRIECDLQHPDGHQLRIGPCTSEIHLRNEFPETMSRYSLRKNEEAWENHRSSGLLLACGTGSTGWFQNARPVGTEEQAIFSKQSPYFQFVVREPNRAGKQMKMSISKTVQKTEILEVISEMHGLITVDAGPDRVFPFPPGSNARFFLSQQTLPVIQDILPGN